MTVIIWVKEKVIRMTVQQKLKEKKMSVYRLAKESRVPYATVNDICNNKAQLEKCTAETIYRIAQVLKVSMEELLAPCFEVRSSFENFKSTICHRVKESGDVAFLIDTLESDAIRTYYDRKWYPECLYLLAMVDYLSRENSIPLDSEYDDLRRLRLDAPVYPVSVLALAAAANSDAPLKNAEQRAIPEFKRFNIIENEVRNVI